MGPRKQWELLLEDARVDARDRAMLGRLEIYLSEVYKQTQGCINEVQSGLIQSVHTQCTREGVYMYPNAPVEVAGSYDVVWTR